ncbi:MAG: hypothetical protein IKD93_08480 [Firmicutes bacterium]|nr:hypothetical protein [Bacillota bacterium]
MNNAVCTMDISQLLTLLGVLAGAVSALTQLTKNLGPLSRVPTDAQVIVTALALSFACAGVWAGAGGQGFSFSLGLAATVAGLLAAFIAMYGWATFYDLWERFLPGGERDE